jgi:hypothetical protein
MRVLAALWSITFLLSGCASINLGGSVYMKRSRVGEEAPVTDLRTMDSYSEINSKGELRQAQTKRETKTVLGELPPEGYFSPH